MRVGVSTENEQKGLWPALVRIVALLFVCLWSVPTIDIASMLWKHPTVEGAFLFGLYSLLVGVSLLYALPAHVCRRYFPVAFLLVAALEFVINVAIIFK